jgi:hypothetical protein
LLLIAFGSYAAISLPGLFAPAAVLHMVFVALVGWIVVEVIRVIFVMAETLDECRDHLAAIRAQQERK